MCHTRRFREELRELDSDDETFDAKFHELMENVEHHVEEEESEMLPLGVAFNKGLHIHMGQMHGQKYIPRLFDHWRQGHIDSGFVFAHHVALDHAPQAYSMFRNKQDRCIKVAWQPQG